MGRNCAAARWLIGYWRDRRELVRISEAWACGCMFTIRICPASGALPWIELLSQYDLVVPAPWPTPRRKHLMGEDSRANEAGRVFHQVFARNLGTRPALRALR